MVVVHLSLRPLPQLWEYLKGTPWQAADGPLHFLPCWLIVSGSQLGQLGARPFPHQRWRRRGVEGPGSPGVGNSCDWCMEVGVWNVKGRDHLQGVILHGLAQIQQLQNTTQRDRSDVGALTEDFPSAPNHSQGLKFSTTQEVIVSNKPVSSSKFLSL